jgi:L-rhamnose mutarotase
MNAYHVYYQNSSQKNNEYEAIDFLVQIASILFWKKNHGNISLYCNSEYLPIISKWGIDKLYTSINTDCLDKMPYSDVSKKYWSFCKIHAALDISEIDKDFCIIDTDLWIQEPINIDSEYQFIGYHAEQYLDDSELEMCLTIQEISSINPYINPKLFLNNKDYSLLSWDILPINCAFLYLNSKDLVKEWYKWTVKVIELNKDKDEFSQSADTIFIEQRLLPTIAYGLKLRFGTLIPNIYYPHIPSDNLGTEWKPRIGFDELNQYMSWNIKHIWGLKKMYDNIDIRNMVIDTVIGSLDNYLPNWKLKYSKLYEEVISYTVNSNELSK